MKAGKLIDVMTNKEIGSGWEATNITNAKSISVTVNKTWHDNGFSDVRPASVTISLYKKTGDKEVKVRDAQITAENNWTVRFDDLARYEDGKQIEYFVREELGNAAYNYYSYVSNPKTDNNGNQSFTVANSIKKTNIIGHKAWTDGLLWWDSNKPGTIRFYLYQVVDGKEVQMKDHQGNPMVSEKHNWENWAFEFKNLPTYDINGKEAVYVVKEEASDNYVLVKTEKETNTENGQTTVDMTLTNRVTVALRGTKVWEDSGNINKARPDHVTLVVLQNNEKMNPQPEVRWTNTDKDVWNWEITGLPKYKDGTDAAYTYTVKEADVPEGYVSTVSSDNKTITNTMYGELHLYKVYKDEKGENVQLNGATFQLYYDEACQEPVNGKNCTTQTIGMHKGRGEIKSIVPGVYYLKEESAPAGYVKLDKPIKVTIVAGQNLRVNEDLPESDPRHGVIVNNIADQVGAITLTKVDAVDSNKKLSGAVFGVYKQDGTPVVMMPATDESGVSTVENIPVGTYYVQEITAPEGYELETTTKYEVAVTANSTAVVNNGNVIPNTETEKFGAITLTKADAVDSNKKLSGAVFGVYKQDGTPVVTMPATDERGVSTVENVPVGTYYVQEITAPEGYELDTTTKYEVAVTANSTAVVNNGNVIPNTETEKFGAITLTKADAVDSNKKLSGAVFGVYK